MHFTEREISKILLKLAPPVMLAQLIQALYNIIDSLFIGRFSDDGLTALSIVYPLQLLMIALAVGTGVGINTIIAAKLGEGREKEANEYAGVGTPLATVLWLLFCPDLLAHYAAYARMSTESETIIQDVITYGRIVCLFSFGLFLESIWTKVLQANGDMKTPMVAQIVGAVTNIYFRPLADFWYVWTAPNGHCRSCCCHRCRTDRCRTDCYEEGLSPFTCKSGLSPIHCKDLPFGNAQHPHAVCVYLLYPWPESYPGGLLRSGCYCAGTLL